jgi:hypothetical protein
MKSGLMHAWVAGVLLASAGVVMAEEAAVAAPKPEAAPKKEGAHAPKPMAERTTWHGVVSAPATNAPAEVVAVLAVKRGPEALRNLTAADAAVVAQLKELAGRHAMVQIKGTMDKEHKTIAVTACKEVTPKTVHAKPADEPAAAPAAAAPEPKK